MERLIDAYEFAKKIENTDANVCADYGDSFCEFGYSRSLLRLLLSETPTVDAVEVVRCRDCKFFEADFSDDGVSFGRCVVDYPDIEFVERLGYDFCSYGERRTDG